MVKICVDAMGSDYGSSIVVEAIKFFLEDYNDVEFVVVGKKEELKELEDLVRIVDARDVMGMEDGALEVMRKKETSMIKAIKEATNEDIDAVVSAGSTGAFLTASTIHLKLMEGVTRAALVSPFPTIKGGSVIILDIGANNENTPEHLVLFAKMGRIFAQIYKNMSLPRIFLLSNGAEENKGSPVVKKAHQLLKEEKLEGFEGNIEARYVFNGEADVVVTGGFEGNILLKNSEGVASLYTKLLKRAFTKNIFSKIGYLFVKSGLKDMKERLDYKNYGGALLLGVNKVVVKAHGSSDARSFYHALRLAYEQVRNDVIAKIKKELFYERII